MNTEATVTICFGLEALIKKSIGLKKIPPPIPITPEIKPKTPPIKIEITIKICEYAGIIIREKEVVAEDGSISFNKYDKEKIW